MAEGLTLREQLGGSSDPDFEIKLPVGWERRSPDDGDRRAMETVLKRRLMAEHRPDIYAKLAGMVSQSYEAMQKQGAIAFYAPTQAEPTSMVPGSMIASMCRPPGGGTLDDLVRYAIREYGAKPLFGDKRFARFEREKVVELEGASFTQTSIVYMTPIPGSYRRRGLQLNATFGRPLEVPAEDEKVQLYRATFDLMVSSLRWHTE